jgi:hypothetical protein
MRAANGSDHRDPTHTTAGFEADYAGESGTIVPLFSSTASISSTALDACMIRRAVRSGRSRPSRGRRGLLSSAVFAQHENP